MEEAQDAENLVRSRITNLKIQINDLQLKLQQCETELQSKIANRQQCQEDAFEKAYGHSAQKVRDDYVKLVIACCYTGSEGYTVHVPGTNPNIYPHWVLRPERRAICEPTPLVLEAFKIIGDNVSIANETHIERW